jgi:CheY-like chemotaxis protein
MILILVVEDNDDKADMSINVALESGIDKKQIKRVTSVSDAIEEMRLIQYDIVVLDMNLPIRNKGKSKPDSGLTILTEIENDRLQVPRSIIGVTAYDELKEQYSEKFKSFDFNLYSSASSDDWEIALKGKINWLKRSKKSTKKNSRKKVIITVHGISTAGKWQDKLEKSLPKNDPNIVCKKFEYFHISALKLLSNRSKDKIYNIFSMELDALFTAFPDSDFYFFSHSFGTYLLGHKLQTMTVENSPRIRSVVLAGSVLKRNFPWCEVKKNLNIGLIVNDCGTKDLALLFSELFTPKLGMAGRTGFYTFESESVINRFHVGGHSFFEESPIFYNKYWLPILDDLTVIKAPDIDKGSINELLENLFNNIKLYFWGAVLTLVTLFYFLT